jgi:hypothetical protein
MSESGNTGPTGLTINERLKTWKFWKPVVFTAIGGLGGFLYYYFVGCSSGSCPITSNPYISIMVGGLMGYLVYSK